MYSGVIANRYAEAFLKFVKGSPDEEAVYQQVRRILSTMSAMRAVRDSLLDPNLLSVGQKLSLVDTMVSPEALRPEIARLLTVMCEQGRSEFFRLALLDFLNLYITSKGRCMVRITTATAPDGKLEAAVSGRIRQLTGLEPVIVNVVDPSLIGGFIAENWDYRLDASVRTSLETACKKLSKVQKRML